MSVKNKTKQGMASIYIVVFTTLLISIITISFLRIMLSESGRTTKDTLSDSAYNSALAGVEDAKTVYAMYQKALAGDPAVPSSVKTSLENPDAGDDCDVIRKALGESAGSEEYTIDNSVSDQAYTCVTMSLEGDFEGSISKDSPVLVVPLRSKDSMTNGNANSIKRVKISWQNYNVNENASEMPSYDIYNYGAKLSDADVDYRSIVNAKDLALKDKGIFGEKGMNNDVDIVDLNALNVMLAQSPKGVADPDYYSSHKEYYYKTNRSYLTLIPYQDDDESAHNNFISSLEMGLSADKTINQPLPVYCSKADELHEGPYCTVTISLPEPYGGSDRDPENFFLVLNRVYSDPSLRVTVTMYDTYGNEINFWNVQPIVDATGRAGDLMRRVEARLGTDNGADLLPTAELSVEGDINKNFYVTKNCIRGVEECNDSGKL